MYIKLECYAKNNATLSDDPRYHHYGGTTGGCRPPSPSPSSQSSLSSEPLSIARSTTRSHLPPLAVGIVPPSVDAFVVPDDVVVRVPPSRCGEGATGDHRPAKRRRATVPPPPPWDSTAPPSRSSWRMCATAKMSPLTIPPSSSSLSLSSLSPPSRTSRCLLDGDGDDSAAALVCRPGDAKETCLIARHGPPPCRRSCMRRRRVAGHKGDSFDRASRR